MKFGYKKIPQTGALSSLAGRKGFEPLNGFKTVNRLAGGPNRPLWHLPMQDAVSVVNCQKLTEGEGFEPPVSKAHYGFQDRWLRPLGHPSRRGFPSEEYSTLMGACQSCFSSFSGCFQGGKRALSGGYLQPRDLQIMRFFDGQYARAETAVGRSYHVLIIEPADKPQRPARAVRR